MSEEYIASKNEIERKLIEIFKQILSLEKVYVQDNFVALGGNSLNAVELIFRLRDIFFVDLSIRTIFNSKTIEELSLKIIEEQKKEHMAMPSIKPVSRDIDLPLSFKQEWVFFLDQLLPDNPTYIMPLALELKGNLQITALRHTIAEIIRRHESLRAGFEVKVEKPVQVIKDEMPVVLNLVNLNFLASTDKEMEVQRIIAEEAVLPFDLKKDLMLRSKLVIRDDDEYVILLTMHNIISDGWSTKIFQKELNALYIAYSEGKPSPLPELPIQYADFALWQQKQLSGEVLKSQLFFWKNRLSEIKPFELSIACKRRAIRTYCGNAISFFIEPDVTDRLRSISQETESSLYMILLAGFCILLSRYSGQEDITLGSLNANRNRKEVEGLIGFFENILVMRTDLSGDLTFFKLLERVRNTALDAYDNQDMPFERLVEELQPERDLSRNPLVKILFTLQNAPSVAFKTNDLSFRTMESSNKTVRFDMEIYVAEAEKGLSGTFKYNNDLFDPDTVSGMVKHFINLLESLVENPNCRIYNINMLSEEETHKILVEWNDTDVEYPDEKYIHEVFEEQVKMQSDSIALVLDNNYLTYLVLDKKSNQVAHYLSKRGIIAEIPVGICLERSFDMIIGILGVLKAGGMYVPLDPGYPVERLNYMISDSKVAAILTWKCHMNRIPELFERGLNFNKPVVFCLDIEWKNISKESEELTCPLITNRNSAYLIYTSGSTGKPKGVIGHHLGLFNLSKAQIKRFDVKSESRILQFASLSFDASISEVIMALCSGATLCLAQKAFLLPGPILENQINIMAITQVTLPPSALLLMDPEKLYTINAVIVAGEVCSDEVVKRWHKKLKLINAYGPTESTVCVTMGECNKCVLKPPIGKPIDNTKVYILNLNMQILPIGVSGELYVSGIGLANGYLNNPDLTAEKFIPNIFGNSIGKRLYRTGDLVRYIENGNIEFVDRVDQQVKIHGFRIETGEIEAVLSTHPDVKENAVIVREDSSGNKRLAAYIVLTDDNKFSLVEIRNYLKKKLPDFMIPSAFVILPNLPLTPNGKVDRNNFPTPEKSGLESEYIAPRNDIERILANVWKQILNVEKVGIYDNFFYLGGHSLNITQVMSRIRKRIDIEIPYKVFFKTPVLSDLAEYIVTQKNKQSNENSFLLEPAPRNEPIPLSFSQERIWLIEKIEDINDAYNAQAVIEFRGKLDIDAVERSLNLIIDRHEIYRTTFHISNTKPVQKIHDPEKIRLKIINLERFPSKKRDYIVRKLIQDEINVPFNVEKLPLVRWKLFRLSSKHYLMTHVEHHLVHDGWSFNVFLKELLEIYKAFSKGEKILLPYPKFQFADFAYWQRRWVNGDEKNKQLEYWKQQLANCSSLLELPYDRPRPVKQSFRGGSLRKDIPIELCSKLRKLAYKTQITKFMALLTAYVILLYRYSGQEDICIGNGMVNRRILETEEMLGMIINTVALRIRIFNNPTIVELLSQVRTVLLDASENQDIPFNMVVNSLNTVRDSSYNPIFQVAFDTHSAPMPDTVIQGLEGRLNLPINNGSAKFDLSLIVVPHSSLRFSEGQNKEDEGMTIVWDFNSDLFDSLTIERMANHYQRILELMVDDYDSNVCNLKILSKSEMNQILVEWNRTGSYIPNDKSIHHMIEEQAMQTPDIISCVIGNSLITYNELNNRSNKLAKYLNKKKVGPDIIVGICVDRSIEMIIGILGILKAGGVYLPLDPEYPEDRIIYMLNDSRASVLLTQNKLAPQPSKMSQMESSSMNPVIINLDSEWNSILRESEETLRDVVINKNSAYIIYTSGSTGKPKGVIGCHQGLCNLANDQIRRLNIKANSRVLQFASLSFDAFVWEIIIALCSNSTLCLSQKDSLLPGTPLEKTIKKYNITHLLLSPSALALVHSKEMKTVHALVVGGEACPNELASLWHDKVRLFNAYGPTEASVITTTIEYGRKMSKYTIGRPINNAKVHILDKYLQPLPLKTSGEIWIGGIGLSHGYLNRSDITADKFLPDPFNGIPGNRIYRTGDLARYLEDGQIDFVTRLDKQVKIRGFRIELGEIESVILEYPGIRDNAVIVSEDNAGDKRLVAYIIPSIDKKPEISEIRKYLKQKLPDYMIPSAFVILDELPLTPNGKVNRENLPSPESSGMEKEYVAPQTSEEKFITEIWCDVLGLDKVGIYDNFFEIGGHSLIATQIVSRMNEKFSMDIPIGFLFEFPNIKGLADYINTIKSAKDNSFDSDRVSENGREEFVI